jgi:hypothetical protein
MEPNGTRDSMRLDMSSLDIAASPPIRRDETVQISLLLAFTRGYLDAYTWTIPGMRNAYEITRVSATGLETDCSSGDLACRIQTFLATP